MCDESTGNRGRGVTHETNVDSGFGPACQKPIGAAMSLLVLLACLMAGAQSACLHVDAFVINDEIRWRLFGTRVEQATSDLMSTVSSMFQASSDESSPYGCIRVRLAGQTTWTMTNPMAYPTCAQTGQCGPDAIGAAVDPSAMLDALNAWVKKDAMTKLTSRPVIVLLTGESFPGMSRGISNQGTMCTEDAQVAVSVTTGDQLHDAQLVAHEIGHIVNMAHNADKNSIMVEQSRSSAIPVRFLESDLRHAQGASCAPDVGNAPSRRCGNGIVDEGEQCDPGLAEDACCTDTCQLAPGCQCAYSDACCVDGRFAPAGHVCRPARHGVCDQPEVCTGASGACPADQFAPVGTECDDDLGASSSCYDGRCALSLKSQCRKHPGDQHSFACASHRCDRLYCSESPGLSQMSGACTKFIERIVASGSPCGDDQVCVDGACIAKGDASAELIVMSTMRSGAPSAWQISAWSTCRPSGTGCIQTRQVSCPGGGGGACPTPSQPITARRPCTCPDDVSGSMPASPISALPLVTLAAAIILS